MEAIKVKYLAHPALRIMTNYKDSNNLIPPNLYSAFIVFKTLRAKL